MRFISEAARQAVYFSGCMLLLCLGPAAIRADDSVEEITTLGERSNATDMQDESDPIRAFAMADLDRANIFDVESLAFSVPGLHVGRQGNDIIVTLRGIGTENASITGESGVGFEVDGVPYLRPAAAQLAFFDLEGVQVRRGPQGTQGGKGSTSGRIALFTRKPSDVFEVDLDYQIGSFEQRRLRAALNLPINEFAQTRFAVFSEGRDGYQDNLALNDDDRDAFDADSLGARAHLSVQLAESIDLLSSFNYFKQEGVGPLGELLPLEPLNRCGQGVDFVSQLTAPLACPRTGKARAREDTINTPNAVRSDFGRTQDNQFWGVTETLTFSALPLETELKLTGGFQSTKVDFAQDFDFTEVDFSTLDVPRQDSKQYSGEAQWSSIGGERLDWQFSLFFQRETSDLDLTMTRLDVNLGSLEDLETPVRQATESKSYGVALHTDWYLSDSTTLGLGARYSKDSKRSQLLRQNPDPTLTPGALFSCEKFDETDDFPRDGIPDRGLVWCERNFRHVTGSAALEHYLTEENMLYARVDSGYKPGGFRALTFGDFEPEFIWAYSLGSKNQFFGERLTLNLEAFYYDYRDLQLVVRDGLSILSENGDAEVFGFDFEADVEPLPGLRVESSVGYLHTELTAYDSIDPTARLIDDQGNSLVIAQLRDNCLKTPSLCPFRPEVFTDPSLSPCLGPGGDQAEGSPCKFDTYPTTDFSGNDLSRAPDWKLSLAVQYSLVLADLGFGSLGSLTPRVQYYWQAESFYRAFNTPGDRQDSYHLTDLKLTWRSPSERAFVELFVDNLEDEEVFQNVLVGDRAQGSPSTAWYDSPRTWGLRAGFRY